MNFFEANLRKVFDNVVGIKNVQYIGRTCYATVSDNNRMKASFVTLGTHEHYEGLKISIIDKNEGKIDSTTIRFEDVWGKKYEAMGNKIAPYMWVYKGKAEWYTPEPSEKEFYDLSALSSYYVGNFRDYDFDQNEGMSGMGM